MGSQIAKINQMSNKVDEMINKISSNQDLAIIKKKIMQIGSIDDLQKISNLIEFRSQQLDLLEPDEPEYLEDSSEINMTSLKNLNSLVGNKSWISLAL